MDLKNSSHFKYIFEMYITRDAQNALIIIKGTVRFFYVLIKVN